MFLTDCRLLHCTSNTLFNRPPDGQKPVSNYATQPPLCTHRTQVNRKPENQDKLFSLRWAELVSLVKGNKSPFFGKNQFAT